MAATDTAPFEGHENRECGEHRTTRERAWCYSCSEWCYPEVGCKGCHVPLLEARIARALALIARQDGNEICPLFAAKLTRALTGSPSARSEATSNREEEEMTNDPENETAGPQEGAEDEQDGTEKDAENEDGTEEGDSVTG